ncbi:MAG: DUF1122 family protein [Thermoprotei archaeon]
MVRIILKDAVLKIINGVYINDFCIYAKNITKGRFSEEMNLDFYLKKHDQEAFLLSVKVFHGRKPYYRPWIEVFNINNEPKINNEKIVYFNSNLENTMLLTFSHMLENGESIYVEYYSDIETKKQLDLDFPPAVSRLGYKLFALGFSWFKNWYFPEGFMEGNVKLQAEKPINDNVKAMQLTKMYEEIIIFIKRIESFKKEWYIINAIERAKNIIDNLSKIGSHIKN